MLKFLSYRTGLLITVLVLVAGCGSPMSAPPPSASPQSYPPQSYPPQPYPPQTLPVSSLRQQQLNIDKAIDKLLVGKAFHNVPNEMKVGTSYEIQAGIAAQQISKNDILKQLQGEGNLRIIPNIRYDPTGVKMNLLVEPDEFKVQSFSSEEQLISSREPAKWTWEIIPLSSGKHHLILAAYVNLEIPEKHKSVSHKFTVFEKDIPVQINFQYSLAHFLTSNWKEVISLILGSGSLAGAVGWFLAKKHEKLDKTGKDTESS